MSKQEQRPSILILDSYYPEFLKASPLQGLGSYEAELDALMHKCFGTYDCYSRGLMELGWDTKDVVLNHRGLSSLVDRSALWPDYDVMFYQNLNDRNPRSSPSCDVVAGQLSCAWPGDEIVSRFDILFTSFPHYIDRISKLGVRVVFLPLAFDPIVYERMEAAPVRDIDWSFVGGLEKQFGDRARFVVQIANEIPGWIYGYGKRGSFDLSYPVWGLDMYKIYSRSKIVLNRHHPASNGYSNNLRMFEATGMGALLLTESSPNIADYFIPGVQCITYTSPSDAVDKIRYYLDTAHEPERLQIAAAGHIRTLTTHTYAQRMPIVDRELRALLESKKQNQIKIGATS